MKHIIVCMLSICFSFFAFSQEKAKNWEGKQFSQDELNSISILSDCYGYIRFFYPNPNTKNFDWIKYLMYAIPKIEKCINDDELKSVLLELFQPICPQISFSTDSLVSNENMLPPYFAVEHKALGTLDEMAYGKKHSPIVKITEDFRYRNMYTFKLKDNLYVNFPVAVKKLPAKTKEFTFLKKEINKIDEGGISLFTALFNRKKAKNANFIFNLIEYRIADMIVRRNYLRHFYPYFSEDGLLENWDSACMNSIEKIAKTDNIHDYYSEICKLLATVKDSHINIWPSFTIGRLAGGYIQSYYPDISLAFANDTCFVDFVGNDYKNEIRRGDVVHAINNISIEKAIQQKILEIPHSTESSGLYTMSVRGKLLASIRKDSVFEITVKSLDNTEANIKIKTNQNNAPFRQTNNIIELLDNNLIYVNLCSSSCTYDNFVKQIDDIQNSKGVIFDMRGYPRPDVLSIISHFIKEEIELGNLLEPVIGFPNQENVKYEQAEKWYVFPAVSPRSKEVSKKYEYKMPQPIQIEKPVVFLIDGKTMSFGETLVEMIKFHKVGTLVGTQTAGCNGDAIRISMPCFTFFMTYNKFLNRDGSQHHGIGVLPDISCEMQLSDIQKDIDTQLEKAKELFQ